MLKYFRNAEGIFLKYDRIQILVNIFVMCNVTDYVS